MAINFTWSREKTGKTAVDVVVEVHLKSTVLVGINSPDGDIESLSFDHDRRYQNDPSKLIASVEAALKELGIVPQIVLPDYLRKK